MNLINQIVQAQLAEPLPNPFPRTIGPNALKYVQEVVESGLTVDMIGRFEQAFAKEMGVKYCIATPGCTAALHVLMLASGFKPGDEIIVSPITDYGTVQGLLAEDLVPVFADTEPGSINFSARTIEACVTPRTRAILCVHKTGIINDMDPINELARNHGLKVYEDACQAVFGEYKGRLAGTLGDAACFSFDAEKTMGSDIGGCMVTIDPELYERARFAGQNRAGVMKAHFGRTHTEVGYAYRMPNCTAAICLAQLEVIREQVAHRDKMARLLLQKLGEIPGITPLQIPDYLNVFSCWMMGFNIDPAAFNCTTEEFALTLADAGVPGAGIANYYLMADGLVLLHDRRGQYPYSVPPASKEPVYGEAVCHTGREFLRTFIRWSSFCEKYQSHHCELAANLVAHVAEKYRKA
ncbi:MAG: hypothetical protein AMXMBFR84_24840 [Candidatus Hydrogenedentota bacterium]